MVQQHLCFLGFNIEKEPPKRIHNIVPTYFKPDKIKELLKEWNTLPDVELYKDLYDVCSQLFLLTYNHKIQNVSYFVDEEMEEGKKIMVMYAEINNTWHLEMKDRYNLHKNLLERVKSNDLTLKFCNEQKICMDEEEGQLSLFL